MALKTSCGVNRLKYFYAYSILWDINLLLQKGANEIGTLKQKRSEKLRTPALTINQRGLRFQQFVKFCGESISNATNKYDYSFILSWAY